MITLVLDASVAAKWFLPAANEPLSDEAFALLKRYTDGQIRFLVPDLFWAEFGNVLWKAVRQERCIQSSAELAITGLQERALPTIPSSQLLPEAYKLAVLYNRTVYDSLYVVAALVSKAQFVTADERLANALAAHLPVKWLGSL